MALQVLEHNIGEVEAKTEEALEDLIKEEEEGESDLLCHMILYYLLQYLRRKWNHLALQVCHYYPVRTNLSCCYHLTEEVTTVGTVDTEEAAYSVVIVSVLVKNIAVQVYHKALPFVSGTSSGYVIHLLVLLENQQTTRMEER